eukprot:Tamp_43385.p1 GENE.Tamp_43385~~Tamp_43385.p1  ORF type:complete len:117 (-),score=5.69 Tamp_43385:36-386(-)
MPAQQHCDSFRYRRAAFYNGLKSKVGLSAAKAAALRINLNIDGCGGVAPLSTRLRALPSSSPPSSNTTCPCPSRCSAWWSDSYAEAAASGSTRPPPPPRARTAFQRSCSNKQQPVD